MKPTRADVLAQLGPRGWWIDHTVLSGPSCGCSPDGPAKTCDLGEALYRLRKAELMRAPRSRK